MQVPFLQHLPVDLHHLVCTLSALAILSGTGAARLAMVLRFVHLGAGILWLGLLYFFNLVNLRFMRELDPQTRARVYPRLMRPALWWFRWASVVTVLAGIWYWMIIVVEDKISALAVGLMPHSGRAIGSFFAIWTAASLLMVGILSMGKLNRHGAVLAIVFTVLLTGAGWLYLRLNSTGWESSRQLTIGIGGGLGWVMLNNVWGALWRAQKKIIRWMESQAGPRIPTSGAPTEPAVPPEIQKLMLLSAVTARTNFWLSFPMLFFMAAASHYVLFLAK